MPVVSVGPKGDLADRVVSPPLTPGDTVSVFGLVEDTGALTLLTSYNWNEEGIIRTVFFLEPRRPELDGLLCGLIDAVVTETDIYGYGIGLEGGSGGPPPRPFPTFTLPEDYPEYLTTLDLDKLSKHPEHNGDYRPDVKEITALAWTLVDVEEGQLLYRSEPLPLPPFADPQLTRWLQAYALIGEDGEPIRFYVGIRGAFAE
ncbi:hypothetical protein K8R78_08915 [bacterium]|nr:hypothetical protein [bacterium]